MILRGNGTSIARPSFLFILQLLYYSRITFCRKIISFFSIILHFAFLRYICISQRFVFLYRNHTFVVRSTFLFLLYFYFLFLRNVPSKDHFLQPLTTRSLSLFAFMAVPCAVENYSLIGLANQIAFYKIRHDRYMYTNKYLSVSVTNAIVPSNDTHSRSLGKVVEQLLDNLYDSLVHLFAA